MAASKDFLDEAAAIAKARRSSPGDTQDIAFLEARRRASE